MTGISVSKSVLISSMLKEVNERLGRTGCCDQLEKFNNIQIVTKGGILLDFDKVDRIYVEY